MCLVLRLLSLNIGLWYSYEIPSGILVIMNEKSFDYYCHWISSTGM